MIKKLIAQLMWLKKLIAWQLVMVHFLSPYHAAFDLGHI